jgi:hypothetical protein
MRRGVDAAYGAGWMVLGAAIFIASWRMDRLANLNINPWSVPGLLPGLLGALMVLFGAVLCLRPPAPAGQAPATGGRGRVWLALALCGGFACGLLGRGLPFFLTAAGFLFVSILVFRWIDRDPGEPPGLGALAVSSAVIALAASGAISLLFQKVFLVRLP